ncbi:MAG: SIS domain-containing protein [Alphaproteobacteria bacterium]|nr:SIS domain-containing protein [Alphaproteobacteria bacterium]MDE2495225.1 SIS domain-containing protein [Alphaproteobacteria bacterium]
MFTAHRDPRGFAESYADHLAKVLRSLDFGKVGEFIDIVLKARNAGRHVFFVGNGGSAATASHFANDFAIGTRCPEKPFKAVSLTDNVAAMTAIANDDGYEHLFTKQLEVLLEPGDVVVAISASGNSPNVVKALEYANARGNHTVALTGFESGGRIAEIAKTVIHVKTRKGEYGPVEDAHIFIDHLVGSYLNRVVLVERQAAG